MFDKYFNDAFIEALHGKRGYSKENDSYDRIRRSEYPTWPGWKEIDALSANEKTVEIISDMPVLVELSQEFYYQKFWIGSSCDQIAKIDVQLAKQFFIIATELNSSASAVMLQDAINKRIKEDGIGTALTTDGDIGQRTLSAIYARSQTSVDRDLLSLSLYEEFFVASHTDTSSVTVDIIGDPWEYAYKNTGGHEGGYSNNPKDRGGETWAGISRNNFPKLDMWKLIDALPSKSSATISKIPGIDKMVKDFYYDNFWLKNKCDEVAKIHPPIAIELYDSAVNTNRGGKFLQQALNRLNVNETLYPDIVTDGVVGSNTLKMVAKCCKDDIGKLLLLECMNGEQYTYYCSLKDHEYWRGWFART